MDLATFTASYPQIMRDFARDYLGGEYFALSLRATCRAARAAISAPAHMTAEQLMIIASDTSRPDLFMTALARLGTKHISRETAARLMVHVQMPKYARLQSRMLNVPRNAR